MSWVFIKSTCPLSVSIEVQMYVFFAKEMSVKLQQEQSVMQGKSSSDEPYPLPTDTMARATPIKVRPLQWTIKHTHLYFYQKMNKIFSLKGDIYYAFTFQPQKNLFKMQVTYIWFN